MVTWDEEKETKGCAQRKTLREEWKQDVGVLSMYFNMAPTRGGAKWAGLKGQQHLEDPGLMTKSTSAEI